MKSSRINAKATTIIMNKYSGIALAINSLIALPIKIDVMIEGKTQRLNNQIASEKQYDYDYKTIDDEDSFNEYMNQHQQQRSESVHETKEQIMERLFNEYRCGDISEEELDERLKNLEEQND